MSDGFWKILALKGIKGGGDTPTQEKTVALDMANGNQIITPDDDKIMTQATVLKPTTMAAENIKSGVNIGGVVGSLVGKLPEEEKSVTITENGTTEVNSTDGKVMTKVAITVDVAIDNDKILQIISRTVTELTADDLKGLTSVGDLAFSGCSRLTSITIPNSVTSIGNSVFSECSSLTNVTIPDSVTSIGTNVFYYCRSLTHITIPGSISKISNDMFNGCASLTSITILEGVTSIGNNVFYYCEKLTSIIIPNSVTDIGGSAFYSCRGLTSIIIPNSVTSIGRYAFYHCVSLTSITIGNSITSIGGRAFENCFSLTSVTILATTPPTIDSDTFISSFSGTIIVPKGTGDAYKAATNWSKFADHIQEAAE